MRAVPCGNAQAAVDPGFVIGVAAKRAGGIAKLAGMNTPLDRAAKAPAAHPGWRNGRMLVYGAAVLFVCLVGLSLMTTHYSEAPAQKAVDLLYLSSCIHPLREQVEQRVRLGTTAALEEEVPIPTGESCATVLRRIVIRPSGAIAADVRIAPRGEKWSNQQPDTGYKRVDARIVFIPQIEGGVVVRWQKSCTPPDLYAKVICDAPS